MPLKERNLVRQLRARDEAAFAELVRTYQHKVYNVIYRIVGDSAEAEDVAQEVFVSVFKHIDSFRGEAKLSTWIYRIAMNQARNRAKYHSRRAKKSHQEYDDSPDSAKESSPLSADVARPEEMALGKELEEIIQDGLAELNEIHRTILVLRDIQNLAYGEIATIVDLPEGTVKSRLFRARLALKEYVESRYDS